MANPLSTIKMSNTMNIKNVCYAFMFTGIAIILITILIVISSGNYSRNLLIGTLSGYSTTTVGILGLIVLFMIIMTNKFDGISKTIGISLNYSTLYDNIAIIIQFLLIIIILAYSFAINSIYFNKISENNVADSYKWLLFSSTLLLFVQFVILMNLIGSIYNTVSNTSTITKNILSNNVKVMIALFVAIINMTMLITASGNLVFFSTDG